MSETIPEYGGCPWPIDEGCLSDEWDNISPEDRERSVAYASATLTRLTGYRVGGCPVKVRPCAPRCGRGLAYTSGDWMVPTNWNGTWINGCGHRQCSCETLCEVALPPPVGRVDEVKVDGVIVPPTDYEVQDHRLVYVGGGDCPWPATQDLALADTEPDTFSVTYLNTYPVDGLGAHAAGVLAMEFAKMCAGSTKCRLPATVRSVVRQGVSFDIIAGVFPNGQTGLREVDAYIGLWNPNGLRQEAQVMVPGRHRPRVTP